MMRSNSFVRAVHTLHSTAEYDWPLSKSATRKFLFPRLNTSNTLTNYMAKSFFIRKIIVFSSNF